MCTLYIRNYWTKESGRRRDVFPQQLDHRNKRNECIRWYSELPIMLVDISSHKTPYRCAIGSKIHDSVNNPTIVTAWHCFWWPSIRQNISWWEMSFLVERKKNMTEFDDDRAKAHLHCIVDAAVERVNTLYTVYTLWNIRTIKLIKFEPETFPEFIWRLWTFVTSQRFKKRKRKSRAQNKRLSCNGYEITFCVENVIWIYSIPIWTIES